MFSTKNFNFVTFVLTGLFFLSITMSIIVDIQAEAKLGLEFDKLLQDIEFFNDEHSISISDNVSNEEEEIEYAFNDSKETLLMAQEKLEQATSYYSEAEGTLSATAYGYDLEIDLWLKNILFEDGDFIQEAIAIEKGSLFGGKKGGMIIYYDKENDIVYRNFTWTVLLRSNEWMPIYSSDEWVNQTVLEYKEEFGLSENQNPGESLYDISYKTVMESEELITSKDIITGEAKNYYARNSLSAIKSTYLYKDYMQYIFDSIKQGLIKKVEFKEVDTEAVITSTGYFKSLSFREEYNVTINLNNFPISPVATVISEMKYLYASFNQEIDYQKPYIPIILR